MGQFSLQSLEFLLAPAEVCVFDTFQTSWNGRGRGRGIYKNKQHWMKGREIQEKYNRDMKNAQCHEIVGLIVNQRFRLTSRAF